jgi:ADP-L-glycero-D-manno-heptose 6-epimerase
MYGYSKHLFDLWAYDEGVLDQFVGLKYFNVFGPNEWHKARMASAVLHMYGQIQDTGLVKLFSSSEPERFGDGEQCRDFVYVKDVARITCSFILSTQGGIFNVGTGQAQTWNALASALFQALKREANIQYVPMPQDLLGKYQNYTCADVSKLQAALGDMAETQALEDSVADYVQGHLIEEKRW